MDKITDNKNTDIGKKIINTKKEIAELNAQLANLMSTNMNKGVPKSLIPRKSPQNVERTTPVSETMETDTPLQVNNESSKQNAPTNVVLQPSQLFKEKKHPTTSQEVNVPSHVCRKRDYDVESAREYIKKQREKRDQERRNTNTKSKTEQEIRKQKLLELRQKSLELVQKNIKKKNVGSKSKEKKEEIRLDRNVTVERQKPSPKKVSFRNVTVRSTSTTLPNTKPPPPPPTTTPTIITNKAVDEVAAAIKIQAFYRGYKERKMIKMVPKPILECQSNTQPDTIPEVSTKESKENQTNAQNHAITQLQPVFLRNSTVDPYPCNFINTVRKKLQFLMHSPIQSRDVAVQNSIASREEKGASNSRIPINKPSENLDPEAVAHLNLVPPSKTVFKHDSESDTSKNIPDITTETSSMLDLDNEKSKFVINTDRLDKLTLIKRDRVKTPVDYSKKTYTPYFSEAGPSTQYSLNYINDGENGNAMSSSETYHSHRYKSVKSYNETSTDSSISSYLNNLGTPTASRNSQQEIGSNQYDKINTHANHRTEKVFVELHPGKSKHHIGYNEATNEKNLDHLDPHEISDEDLLSPVLLVKDRRDSIISFNRSPDLVNKPNGNDNIKEHQTKESSDIVFVTSPRDSIISFNRTPDIPVRSNNVSQSSSSQKNDYNIEEISTDQESAIQTEKSNDDKTDKEKVYNAALPTKSDRNEIHLKFETEVHLLNDFNESLQQFKAVEKAFESIRNKNGSTHLHDSIDNSGLTVSNDSRISLNLSRTVMSSINISRGSDIKSSGFSNSVHTSTDTLGTTRKSDEFRFDISNNENIPNDLIGISLAMFEQLIKEEDARIDNLRKIIAIRKQVLLDRTKGELAWLEIQRNHLKKTGQFHEASLVKKKQRGIILKHQQESREMQRLKELQKTRSNERKTILKEQRNLIKIKLMSKESPGTELKVYTPRKRKIMGPMRVLKIGEPMLSETAISTRLSDSSEMSNMTAENGSLRIPENDTLVESNISLSKMNRALLLRQEALMKRRRAVEELLQKHQKLLEEEKKIKELEMTAKSLIMQRPISTNQQKQPIVTGNLHQSGVLGKKNGAVPLSQNDSFNNSIRENVDTITAEEKSTSYSDDFEVETEENRVEAEETMSSISELILDFNKIEQGISDLGKTPQTIDSEIVSIKLLKSEESEQVEQSLSDITISAETGPVESHKDIVLTASSSDNENISNTHEDVSVKSASQEVPVDANFQEPSNKSSSIKELSTNGTVTGTESKNEEYFVSQSNASMDVITTEDIKSSDETQTEIYNSHLIDTKEGNHFVERNEEISSPTENISSQPVTEMVVNLVEENKGDALYSDDFEDQSLNSNKTIESDKKVKTPPSDSDSTRTEEDNETVRDLSRFQESYLIAPSSTTTETVKPNQLNIFGNEAEELLKKQLAIEQEIKNLERQQKEQLPFVYMREIPNKPPPPYTPPSNQSLPAATILPSTLEDLIEICNCSAKILYNAYLLNDLNGVNFSETEFKSINNTKSSKECCFFVFDLCRAVAKDHYSQFEKDNPPLWMKPQELSRKIIGKPFDYKQLENHITKNVKLLLGFEKPNMKENSIIKWSKKKKDHVDEILILESQAEERDWLNYEKDELMVKNDVVNEIFEMLLQDTVEEFMKTFV